MPFVGRFLTCTRGTLVDQWLNYCFGLCLNVGSGVVLGLSRGSPYTLPSKSLPTVLVRDLASNATRRLSDLSGRLAQDLRM